MSPIGIGVAFNCNAVSSGALLYLRYFNYEEKVYETVLFTPFSDAVGFGG
jgi:hypothetical protein